MPDIWRWQNNGTSDLWAAALLSDGFPVVAGSEESEMVALKLDPEDGSVVWRWKDKVDGFGSFVGAAADAEGSVILTARTSQESSDDDYIALKLDPDGSVLWRLEDAGEYVAAGPEGSVIMSGGDFGDFSLAKLDASGNLSWHWTVESDSCYTGNALAMTDDDAEVIAGTTSCSAAEMSAGGDDFVAFKVDMDGNEIWRWQDGTEHRDTIYSAVAAEDGSVILSGSTDGSFARSNQMGYDMVAIKLDTNGDEVWRWQGGTAAVDKTLSSAIGADGSLIMTGLTSGDWRRPNLGIYDFMAVKINGLDGSPDDWGWQVGDGSDMGLQRE